MGINIDTFIEEINEYKEIKEMLDFIIQEMGQTTIVDSLNIALSVRKQKIRNHRTIAETHKESTILNIESKFTSFFQNLEEYIKKEEAKKWED